MRQQHPKSRHVPLEHGLNTKTGFKYGFHRNIPNLPRACHSLLVEVQVLLHLWATAAGVHVRCSCCTWSAYQGGPQFNETAAVPEFSSEVGGSSRLRAESWQEGTTLVVPLNGVGYAGNFGGANLLKREPSMDMHTTEMHAASPQVPWPLCLYCLCTTIYIA